MHTQKRLKVQGKGAFDNRLLKYVLEWEYILGFGTSYAFKNQEITVGLRESGR